MSWSPFLLELDIAFNAKAFQLLYEAITKHG